MKPVPVAGHRRTWKAAATAAAALTLPLLALAVPAATASAGTAQSGQTASSPSCPWLNQSLPVDQRVHLLLGQMSLAQKITMVTGAGFSETYVFETSAIPSLCVPAVGEEDGPVGAGDGLAGVTQMPSAVSLAATFDPSLASQYGQVVGSEEHGKGAMVDLGPTINIDRDPRWGRSFEAYTEDPYLNAAMGTADIEGVQSTGEMAQVKHFAVYNQETNRNTAADNATVSTRALHEIYLPGFWAATTQAKASSVMCSYSTINGQAACQNQYLDDTLNQRWDYPGFITSDYQATHSTVPSADAGLDQEMPAPQYYGPALQTAVQDGQVSMATLNGMVSRILTEMFQFNEFNDPPTGSTSAVVTTLAHQATATSVAEAGTVLLKNTGGTLPLAASGGGTVAVIGPAASAAPTDTGGGSAYVTSTFNVTPLQGIQAAAGPGTTVQYAQGLPTDTSLSAIPGSDLTPAYASTGYGGTYTGTLTAPETGTYVLAFQNPGSYTTTTLSLNGQEILANPGTPPVSTYSVGVNLTAGQTYTLQISGGGPSANLSWATPSQLAPQIAQAVAAAKSAATAVVVVSDDTESEAADRAGLNLPSAQDELISAVAAANPHTVVVVDAGAPVAMPWLGQVASVIDAWYPGQSNGTALAAVLFGQVDPSGHLPVTFPAALSQVPASTPAQFPGVNGEVQYSEGIDVGYRYYDANSETPLFPFGYGLSYTSFRYSNLNISRGQVQNATSNPGTTSCGCNGQSGKLVTVSATVTNTGHVAGSDVAQLYLGDPAVAGEPPRQLKGFQKVTLKPGQSTTVRFTLTGHDLSYWDDAANGWVVPDGQFGVYVGDSSAQSSLPLRGHFTVDRSVGARYATLTAPGTVAAGTSATVTATLVNKGDYPMPAARFTVSAPSGWQVASPGPATIWPGQTVTEHLRVTVPAGAAAGDHTLTLSVRSPFGPRTGLVQATATVTVPYASLPAAYNNTGISDNASPATADYDGDGDSYSAEALAAATPTGLTPGQQVTVGGTTFTWPTAAPGSPDNVVTAGQTVALSGSGTDLGFLGASQNGVASGTVTVHYTDGSSQSYSLNMADWYSGSPAVGDQLLTTTSDWNYTSSTQTPHPVSLYFASVPLQPGKQVASVTLPVLSNAGGTTAMHIFAMATGTGTPTVGAPYSSLATAYDNVGITDDSNTAPGNFDGTGDSFSAQALAAGTPTPLTGGGQATVGGTTFSWPAGAGTPDNVIADGQTIDLSGSGTDLGFLGASAFGAASGTGTITYTDGSTQAFSLTMTDWYNNAPVAGDQIADTASYWNGQAAHPVSIYFSSVPLAAGKTVASVTLPTVSASVGSNITAMHIFSMAIGSGTPTSTG
ncbi:MAG TPA: glycoside hydrolase family 3 C-terminal domain-containing protein [Trebonia sp.]|nr:glycoside hydrolase family 3 C-terminal domain-containing protein [Trebonia sp.]